MLVVVVVVAVVVVVVVVAVPDDAFIENDTYPQFSKLR